MATCGKCGRPQFNKGAKPDQTCLRCVRAMFNRAVQGASMLFISDMKALGFSQADIELELARRIG